MPSPQAAVPQDKPVPLWLLHRPQLLQKIPTCSTMVLSAGESLPQYLEHLFPSFSNLGVPKTTSHTFFSHSSLPEQHFLPFLKNVFPEASSPWLPCSEVPYGGAIEAGWNQLVPAGIDHVWHGGGLASPSRGSPAAPTASTWALPPICSVTVKC